MKKTSIELGWHIANVNLNGVKLNYIDDTLHVPAVDAAGDDMFVEAQNDFVFVSYRKMYEHVKFVPVPDEPPCSVDVRAWIKELFPKSLVSWGVLIITRY